MDPELQSDGRVTFRFEDPNAQKVELELEGEKTPTLMQKDDRGIWSLTVGPLQPDIYGYSFVADGVALIAARLFRRYQNEISGPVPAARV